MVSEVKESCIEITEKNCILIEPINTNEKKEEIINLLASPVLRNVLFTSSNAVNAIKKYLPPTGSTPLLDWDIFSISGKTTDALLTYFNPERIIGTAKDSTQLSELILKKEVKEVLYFCGDKRRDELPSRLINNGVIVKEVVVYQTTATPFKCEENFDGILFFSPSAVDSFFSENRLHVTTVYFAIGNTTGQALKNLCRNKVIVSESASEKMMLKTVDNFFRDYAHTLD